ncbi:hypothetical protein CPC197_0432B, partial [Chlamydia psittaci C1/97]
FYHPQWIW